MSPRPTGVYGLRLLSDARVLRMAIGVALVIFLTARAAFFLDLTDEAQWGYDFSAYLWAGDRILVGESPYSPHQLAGPYSPQAQGRYLYPPFLAVAVTPLSAAFEDYRAAVWVWSALGAGSLLAVVVGVARSEGIGSRTDKTLLVGGAFAFAPVVGELVLGNVHLLLLGLFASAWLAIRRGTSRGEFVAGGLVGVATMIKIFPGILVVWFLLTGRPRAALAALAAMAVLVVATVPVTGIGPWLDYPTVLLNLGPVVDPRDALAPTVWLSEVVPPAIARVVVTTGGIAVILGTARRLPEASSFAIAVSVSVLIAPAVYHHYLAIFVLPLLIAVRYAPPIAWVGVAYLLMSGGEQDALGDGAWVTNRLLPTLGAILVVTGLAVRHRGASNAPRSGPRRTIGAVTARTARLDS